MKLRRYATSLLGALALVAAGWSAPATGAESNNLVIFGDSVAADPPLGAYLAGSSADRLGLNTTGLRSCPRSDSSYGVQAAHLLGLEASDYSCSGMSAISKDPAVPQFSQQVDAAQSDGSLSARTQRVVITAGFNDTYSQNSLADDQAVGNYVGAMIPQIQRIRAAAPNARIQLVGYPTITANSDVCLGHLFPNSSVSVPAGIVERFENEAESMGAQLAASTGVEFLSLKQATAGNGMCASDAVRYRTSIIDFTGGPAHLPIHLNARGHAAVANAIAAS